MVEVARQSYQTYRTLQNIQGVMASPKAMSLNLAGRAWNKLYWDHLLSGEKNFFESLGKPKTKKQVVCLYEQDKYGVYQPVWQTTQTSQNPEAYRRHSIHREEFEHCQDVLQNTSERRAELQKQQQQLLAEIGSAPDQLTVQKKQAELAAVQSELSTLQAVEEASVNQVMARQAENQNQKEIEEKAASEEIDQLQHNQKNSFASKFQELPFRQRYQGATLVGPKVAKKAEKIEIVEKDGS